MKGLIAITTPQLYEKIKKLNNSPLELINEAEARELLQTFFDKSLMETPAENMNTAFSLLRKINSNTDEPIQQIDFPDLISTLTFCFDLIYAEKEKRILYYSDIQTVSICAKPERISLSFLDILFNLIELFDSSYYFISLKRLVGKAVIEIEFDLNGKNTLQSLFGSLSDDYIYRINGQLLATSGDGTAKAVISLPIDNGKKYPQYRTPSIEDLLFDRLSVIYSSLF